MVDRPGLEAAIGALHRGDVLLVYRRDRLARSVLLAELIARQVTAAKARIVAVEGDVAGETDSPEAVFVRQIMSAVAELERKMIGARTSRAMRVHQRNGRSMSRFPPYGFRFDPAEPGMLLPDVREQLGVSLIQKFASEGLTPWQTARQLTLKHPDLARGKAWTSTTVAKVLARKIL